MCVGSPSITTEKINLPVPLWIGSFTHANTTSCMWQLWWTSNENRMQGAWHVLGKAIANWTHSITFVVHVNGFAQRHHAQNPSYRRQRERRQQWMRSQQPCHPYHISVDFSVYLGDNSGRRWDANALTSQLVIKFNDPNRVIQFSCCQCHDALHASLKSNGKHTHAHPLRPRHTHFIPMCCHRSARISITPHFRFESLQDGKRNFSFARAFRLRTTTSAHFCLEF